MATPKPVKTAAVIARDGRKRSSLCGWRKSGTMAAAAKAGGVAVATIANWHRDDPEYRVSVAAAIDEYAATAGQLAHNALVQHVEAAQRGDMVLVREGQEAGKPTRVRERVQLNPALCRLLLTRADPRFTHPKQEVEHSGSVALNTARRLLDEQVGERQDTAQRLLDEQGSGG